MLNFAVLVFFIAIVANVHPFKIQQIEDGKAHVRSCIFKIGISPMEVNRLRKGDFSESDDKSHVSQWKCWKCIKFHKNSQAVLPEMYFWEKWIHAERNPFRKRDNRKAIKRWDERRSWGNFKSMQRCRKWKFVWTCVQGVRMLLGEQKSLKLQVSSLL